MNVYILAWNPWVWLFWLFVSTALSYAISQLTMKTPKPSKMKPNDLKMPETDEGVPYTIVFGTCLVENPVVAWWGDIKIVPIMRSYTVNKWFNNKKVWYTVGYWYGAGMHHIICQGIVDGIIQCRVGEVVAWPNPDDVTAVASDGTTSAPIYEENLFGGEDQEGGIWGTVDFQYGESAQTPNDYLISVQGSLLPSSEPLSAHRGLTCAIHRKVYFGTSPYPRPWGYLVKRTTKLTTGASQWYPTKSTINTYDLNPAHILRECYTNTEWGKGHPTVLFPDSLWQSFADTLYDEGFGLSMKWQEPNQTLNDFIQDVLRHIDGHVYRDPETGDFVPKLIRDDYEIDSLESFDQSDIVAIEDFSRGAYHRIPDTLWIQIWDRFLNVPQSLPDHDIALMNLQGGVQVTDTTEYFGIQDPVIGMRVVARDHRQMTSFPAIMKIRAKRTMAHLRPGDVFELVWPPLGIVSMCVRVLRPNYGSPKEGTIILECVEDVFAVEEAVYATPPVSGWTDPRSYPVDVTDYVLQETPFWDVLRDAGLSEALLLDQDSGFLLVCAGQTGGDAYDYEVLLRDSPTDSFYSEGRGHFTPLGRLDSFLPLNAADATATLNDADLLGDLHIGTYVLIDNEILKLKAVDVDNSQVTLARGCLDTVPAHHYGDDTAAPGATVWFAGTTEYISGREFTNGDQPGVKLLPRTNLGQLAEGSATAHNAPVFNSRMNRPYPPGNFKVNGVSYPSTFSGQPTISWTHRDRTQQITEIVEHSEASIGPEAGVTYTLQIYDENNLLVRTETGLTGTSYTYDWNDELSDCGIPSGGDLNSSLRFVLKSVRGGYDSWQNYDLTVNRV